MADHTSTTAFVPHLRCDCVPDLGSAHCHRCSRISGSAVAWEVAPCRSWVETPVYAALLAADAEEALLLVSDAFDRERTIDALVDELDADGAAAEAGAAEACAPGRPVPAPPRQPLAVTPVAADAYRDFEAGAWRFTNLARGQLEELGFTVVQVTALLEAPHTEAPNTDGTAINHFTSGLMLMSDTNRECVISVLGDDGRAVDAAPAPAAPKLKSYSGGPGRRMPSTTKELLELLAEHGFETEPNGGGHYVARHPQHSSESFTVPSTPSDHRSHPNLIARIKRVTGIDIAAARR